MASTATDPQTPAEPYPALFLRFLRFGSLAWGGPVAQIAMIRKELVDDERWISSDQFNKVHALYQVLPGPEAHELCVYFGMRSRGRLGGLLAGLGFMLPGFVLMFALTWWYAHRGGSSVLLSTAFAGAQAAIVAVIIRAVQRIGAASLKTDRWLWAIAIASAVSAVAGVHFAITLGVAGVAFVFAERRKPVATALVVGLLAYSAMRLASPDLLETQFASSGALTQVSVVGMFVSGLKAGMLTFGGAYTAIPFIQHDAVAAGWLTTKQLMDGLALSGILPAPFIIFTTFVGYMGAGPFGALAMTAGVFLPAFGFTLIAHDQLERLVNKPALHTFLLGVTAGVVGLIAVTALTLTRAAVTDATTLIVAAAALVVLFRWKSKLAVLAVVVGGAAVGWLGSLAA
jgi:chromate transporter